MLGRPRHASLLQHRERCLLHDMAHTSINTELDVGDALMIEQKKMMPYELVPNLRAQRSKEEKDYTRRRNRTTPEGGTGVHPKEEQDYTRRKRNIPEGTGIYPKEKDHTRRNRTTPEGKGPHPKEKDHAQYSAGRIRLWHHAQLQRKCRT